MHACQYTECLSRVIRDNMALFLGQPSVISSLVDCLGDLGVHAARAVLVAVMPLMKPQRSTRDAVMLVLRKSLFARSTESNLVGLEGALQLLTTFKIPTSLSGSGGTQLQLSQSSSHSMMSQSSESIRRGGGGGSGSSRGATMEIVCNDLVGVLRRALSRHVEVRLALYKGMSNVADRNPELTLPFLDILYQHGITQGWITMDDGLGTSQGDEARGSANWNLDNTFVEKENSVEVTVRIVCTYVHCLMLEIRRHAYGIFSFSGPVWLVPSLCPSPGDQGISVLRRGFRRTG